MSSRIARLAHNYERHASIPWSRTLAGVQRVWFAVYDKNDERRLRARLGEFEIATGRAGHGWSLVDVTDSFPAWLAAHEYRDSYFENPAATADAIDADGWYHTGDLASMDERGFCRIEGRLKDMIIRGGENIYPREIEAVLFAHHCIADVAVVGIPDDKWGEQVAAFVRLAGDECPTPDELSAHVRAQLASFKVPRTWVFVETFPLTGSGKVQKFALRSNPNPGA